MGRGVAIGTLVCPAAPGNAVLFGGFLGRALAEAEQSEPGEANPNPSGVPSKLPSLPGHTRGSESLYRGSPAGPACGDAAPAPESSRLACGLYRDAHIILGTVAGHTPGDGGRPCQSPSDSLAGQAAPGDLSGPEDRALATVHALRVSRYVTDRQCTRGAAGIGRVLVPGIALGADRSAAPLPGLPAVAHQPGSHRQSVGDVPGMVWRRIDVLARTWAAAGFGDFGQLFRKTGVAAPG